MSASVLSAELIGTRLRKLRGNRTLDEVSQATGVGRSALNMYELGQRVPRDEAKIKLACFYEVSIEWLFFCPE